MNIAIYKNNNFYRYGDILLHKGRWKYPKKVVKTDKQFTGSILEIYLNNNIKYCPEKLLETARQQKFVPVIDDKILYLNIRTGDVLQRPVWMAKYGKTNHYKTLTNWYMFDHERLLRNIANHVSKDIQKVVIVTAMHFGGSVEPDGSTLGDWIYSDDQVEYNKRMLDIICRKISKKFNLPVSIDSIYHHESAHSLTDKHLMHFILAKHVVLESTQASGFSKIIHDIRCLIV